MLRYPSAVRLTSLSLALSVLLLFAREARSEAPPPPASAGERPAAAPDTPSLIPHNLAGRADCLACHGPAGEHPFPEDHEGRENEMCRACHVPATSPKAPKPGEPVVVPVTNNYCLACHGTPSVAMTLPDGEKLSLYVDNSVYEKSTHGRNHMPCTACHTESMRYPHPKMTAKNHGELSRGIVQQSCFNCHQKVFEEFKTSVHGRALVEQGNLDVPGCPDCHGIHNIGDPHGSMFRLESTDTCSHCHADPELAERYGMSPNVVKTYLNDFHGATVRLTKKEGPEFDTYKAVCYDCHGIHDIRKVDDPNSHVVKGELVETCQRCHPGADANFPAAWTSHYEPDRNRYPIVYWVDLAYKILIPGILGPMILYILLDLFRSLINRIRRGKQEEPHESHDGGRTFVRFTLSQRIEHAVQIVSFSTLVVTGLCQKYNTHEISEWIIHVIGGIDRVRSIHRLMGAILIVEAVLHLGVIIWNAGIKKRKSQMLPRWQDAKDALRMVLYFIGLRKRRARFDRYDFRQKAEYWALVWGTIVMVASGLMMWFPVETTSLLPGELIPAAKAAHGGEGLLAFLAILVWHMYSAHLAPEVFPFDKVMFTGKISEERLFHEHPLEYQRMVAEGSIAEKPTVETAPPVSGEH